MSIQESNELSIGLFGFGCVGQGLYKNLEHSQNLKAKINKICIKNESKERSLESSYFTTCREEILQNDTKDIIVELIDDADAAYEITSSALNSGKHLVTANKKMLAENFESLFDIQLRTGKSLLYEGACGGSIPIIRTLEEYYDNEELLGIRGILNGSTNFILSRMTNESISFDEALTQAQELGFAESNPFLDISGQDPRYKLCIIAAHAFGIILKPSDVLTLGIHNITSEDIDFARSLGCKIKLVAQIYKHEDKFRAYVIPSFISSPDLLYNIDNENNGIEVEGIFSGKQLFAGKGAGSLPTGSAVLSDISAITYEYKYGYRKLKNTLQSGKSINGVNLQKGNDFSLKIYIRYSGELPPDTLLNSTESSGTLPGGSSYLITEADFTILDKFSSLKNIFIAQIKPQ